MKEAKDTSSQHSGGDSGQPVTPQKKSYTNIIVIGIVVIIVITLIILS